MTLKVIIFDFDGTIADTLDALVSITNDLSEEFGYKRANPDDIERLKNLSPRQIIKQSGISLFKLPGLLRKVKVRLNKEIELLTPISGISPVLIQLKKNGHLLGIITSNSKENVVIFLKANGLEEVFDFVYSGTTLFGKSKVINSFLSKEHLKPEDVIYVGDEARDIEAAKASWIKIVAVSWGFNSKELLTKHHPDFIIDAPKELIKVVENL